MKIVLNAYLDNNIGDDLMISLFASYFSQHDIYLCVDNNIVKKPFEGINNINFFRSEELVTILNDTDLHVTIGGSLFTLTNYKTWIYFYKRIKLSRILKRKNIKSAIIGCNLGPFDKRNVGFFLAKEEMWTKDLITVRDKESFNKLSGKLKNINLHHYPDIVFNMENNQEKKAKTNILGISVYRSLSNNIDNWQTYESLAKIADSYIEETKGKVKLLAFDCERENDLIGAYYIKKLSKYPENVEIIPYLSNIDKFLVEFSTCDMIIAIRFHSAVLAGVYNIPFIPIAYSNKMKNLITDNKKESKVYELKKLSEDYNEIVEKITNNNLFSFDNINGLNNGSLNHFISIEKLLEEDKNV